MELKPTYQRSVRGTGIYANGRKAAPMKVGSKSRRNPRALKPELFGITWG